MFRELISHGGGWLGAARTWLQWHKINGDRVTWGSSTPLNPPMTVKEVEELAGEVALATIKSLQERGYLTEEFIEGVKGNKVVLL